MTKMNAGKLKTTTLEGAPPFYKCHDKLANCKS